MPQPNPRDVHIDRYLTGILIAYMNDPMAYITDKLFPVIGSTKQSDKVATYDKYYWFADQATKRAPGTETTGSGFTTGDKSFFCENFGTHVDVNDETRRNQDNPFDLDMAAVMIVGHRLRLRREISWAGDFFKKDVWDGNSTLAGTNQWSDYAMSTPIQDIEVARDAIHLGTGREATDLTIGRQVWTKLKHHPDFVDRIRYTTDAIVTEMLVARLLELMRIHIGKAQYITSGEGVATNTFKYIFGKNALLSHVPPAPGLLIPSAGYTFYWDPLRGDTMGAEMGQGYIRYLRDDKAQYDRVEGHTFFDHALMGKDLGYFFENAVG